jgi:hypothetical protein
MDKTLLGKLKIKPQHSLVVLNSPKGFVKPTEYDTRLSPKLKFDAILLFVKDKGEIDSYVEKVLLALNEEGLLWICYPKKSSGIETDLTRDRGWESLKRKGYEGVSLVSVDDTWSAFRFKPSTKKASKPAAPQVPERQVFQAVLENPNDGMDTAYISIPFDVEEVYGTKGMVKVKALFNGYPYRGILSNMGTGSHILIVRKDIRAAIGKSIGEKVRVELVEDTEERVVEMPEELKAALAKSPKAKSFFDTLSYTNRKEYAAWIRDAKREETKLKRLKETISKLLKGHKNPSVK